MRALGSGLTVIYGCRASAFARIFFFFLWGGGWFWESWDLGFVGMRIIAGSGHVVSQIGDCKRSLGQEARNLQEGCVRSSESHQQGYNARLAAETAH